MPIISRLTCLAWSFSFFTKNFNFLGTYSKFKAITFLSHLYFFDQSKVHQCFHRPKNEFPPQEYCVQTKLLKFQRHLKYLVVIFDLKELVAHHLLQQWEQRFRFMDLPLANLQFFSIRMLYLFSSSIQLLFDLLLLPWRWDFNCYKSGVKLLQTCLNTYSAFKTGYTGF